MKNSHELSRKITIIPHGGSGGLVTGSCNQISGEAWGILVDCGLFQGRREERTERGVQRNLTPPAKYAKDISDIVISHTHMDHAGLIPFVTARGLERRILATDVTAEFMGAMLLNSAKIQSQNGTPLYDTYDVDKTLRHVDAVKPFTRARVGGKHSDTTVEFVTNGHVMGAASIMIRAENEKKTLLCTGDIGKPIQSLCGGYEDYRFPTDPVHVLVVESTNFEKKPVNFEEKCANLLYSINETWNRGGVPLLPLLSFHRTQEIMEILHHHQGGLIPRNTQIFIDAPFAMELLKIFKSLDQTQLTPRYGDNPYFYKSGWESQCRFDLNNVTVIQTHQESLYYAAKLAHNPGGAIVLAGGGMFEAGRALNYRGEFMHNPNNAILLTCHQVEGTRGASLLSSASQSDNKKTQARVVMVEGFTSHASGEQIFDFLKRFNVRPGILQTVIINHGKDSARAALAREFRIRFGDDLKVLTPQLNEVIEV